jgi:hypothetical protein
VDGRRLHDPYRPERRSSIETTGNCALCLADHLSGLGPRRKADAVRVDAALNQASATQNKAVRTTPWGDPPTLSGLVSLWRERRRPHRLPAGSEDTIQQTQIGRSSSPCRTRSVGDSVRFRERCWHAAAGTRLFRRRSQDVPRHPGARLEAGHFIRSPIVFIRSWGGKRS